MAEVLAIDGDESKINDEEEDNITQLNDLLIDGPMFEEVEMQRYFIDSKTYVDLEFKNCSADYNDVLDEFENATNSDNNSSIEIHQKFDNLHSRYNEISTLLNKHHKQNDVSEFLGNEFNAPGKQLIPVQGKYPSDYQPKPESNMFKSLDAESKIGKFAGELNDLWKHLYREVTINNETVKGCTFLPLKHKEIIVPGGRFREVYYWDSYWIILGLLNCNMLQSARKLVENQLFLVDKYGFVPNGSRTYYLHRSQPPVLTLMVYKVYEYTQDIVWLKNVIKTVEKEYEYWTNEPRQVEIKKNDKVYYLSRYYSSIQKPRQESHYEDVKGCIDLEDKDKRIVYQNIRSTAMTGWDFSSRWAYDEEEDFFGKTFDKFVDMFDDEDYDDIIVVQFEAMDFDDIIDDISDDENDDKQIKHFNKYAKSHNIYKHSKHVEKRQQKIKDFMQKLDTIHVIPVDLNYLLLLIEHFISFFYKILNDEVNYEKYQELCSTRLNAMMNILYDKENKQFRDYNINYDRFGPLNIASNFMPFWFSDQICINNEQHGSTINDLIESFLQSELIQKGGVVTTTKFTGQQWDFPNCWAPINHYIIDGLYNYAKYSQSDKYENIAIQLANTWLI